MMKLSECYLLQTLGQFTRNYTQTVKRAADNKRRYASGEGSIPPVLLSGVSKGVPPLAHDFAKQSVVCYTLCRRCCENAVAAGEGKGIFTAGKQGCDCVAWSRKRRTGFISRQGVYESPRPSSHAGLRDKMSRTCGHTN